MLLISAIFGWQIACHKQAAASLFDRSMQLALAEAPWLALFVGRTRRSSKRMMGMMGIDGHVLVRVRKFGYHLHTAAAPDGALAAILPAAGQNMPINYLHPHHFLSTHHVAAPPRLLGLFMSRRPSTIRPLLARHQKANLVTSTFALPIAPAAARTAALNSGYSGTRVGS